MASSSNTQRVQSDSLAVGSSPGPQLRSSDSYLLLQLRNTQRVQSDSRAVDSSLRTRWAPLPRVTIPTTRDNDVFELEDDASVKADSLAVGSSLGAEDTWQCRTKRPLSIQRSHPTQVKHSHMQVPRYYVEAEPQESMFKWTDLDQDNIDRLSASVPDASLTFNLESLD